MKLNYLQFYKQYGVRRLQSLLYPKLVDLKELPMDTLIHYITYDETHLDIDVSKIYMPLTNTISYIDFIDELVIEKGNPRRINIPVRTLAKDFLYAHKNFKYIKEHYKSIVNPRSLLINSYNYLYKIYKYPTVTLSEYQKFINIQATIWTNINNTVENSSRNHFMFFKIPAKLPSYSLLNVYSAKPSVNMFKVFDSPDKLMLLEFWKWLSDDYKSESVISKLDPINYGKVTLVFMTEEQKSIIVNLGYLSSWIKGGNNITEFGSVTQFQPQQMQKIFLRSMLSSNETTPPEVPTPTSTDLPGDAPVDELTTDMQREPSTVTGTGTPTDLGEVPEDGVELNLSGDIQDQFKSIDEELDILEQINIRQMKEKGVHIAATDGVVDTVVEATVELSKSEIIDSIYKDKSYDTILKEQLDDYADFGMLTASDYKRLIKDLEGFNKLPDPYKSKQLLTQAMVVTAEDIAINTDKISINASNLVTDKSMLESTLQCYDEDYVNNVMNKDILSMVSSVQKAGVIIKNYTIEKDHSALGSYEMHTLELRPIDGAPSTIRFRIPVVSEEGTITTAGNVNKIRKQRIDLPIRKIDSYKVALTTYYGKNFVTRSDKKANSSYKWLISQINKLSISDQTHIKNVAPANVFSNNFEAPYIYSALSTTYKSLKAGNLNLVFDYVQRETLVTPNVLAYIEQEGRRLVGLTDQGYPVIIDKDNIFHYLKDVEIIPIGDIYQVLQLPVASSPVDFTEVRIYSKTVPVGIVLSYFIGFKSLLTLLDVKYRVVEGKRVTGLGTNDYAISFKNEHYVFSRSDVTASLILGGFLDYAKQIRLYDTSEFNKKDVYLNLLASKGITAIYIRELELCDKLFVDPITKSILIDLNEPVTFRGLLIRATELLKDFHHPDAQDTKYMRIRGYERISGFIYKELTTSIKSFKNRNISGKSKVEMGPYQVWQSIMTDPSLKLPEDTNPVQNLKENEVVTYVGEGGRSKDTMTASSRAYHINDMGVISESTVDSSDVGISAFLSSNPNFKNLRGIIDLEKSVSPTSLVSTTGNLSIGTNHDSAIRSAFSAIQASHVIATDGYRQPYLRTGYEYVIGHRTTEMFCYTAKDNGKVIGKTKLGITVQYDNGKVKGVSLGRLYGKAEGSMYPHDVVTTLKVGDTFTKGQTISYNTGFFEPDMLDPNSVVYKTTMLVKTVLWESSQTFEDSSSISKSLSNKLSAKTTKVKSIDVDFTQNLLEVIKPGTYVHPKDTLMIIVDEVVSGTGYFDEESLSVLRRLSKQSPASKYEGTIDKIEVFYHGSKDDMSSSLRSLADVSDKYLSDSAKASNKPVINGQVNSDYRVNGKPLAPDRAEIKVYITISTGAGVGD